MNTPGILPTPPELNPIHRVSPSRFVSLELCALREVWASAREARMLASSPAAILGTVAHKLLEEVAKGALVPAIAERIQDRWNELVADAEETMASSWLDRSLVPLSVSCRDYFVRRARSCDRALDICLLRGQAATTSPLAPHQISLEKWLESSDGSVGGYVDYVDVSASGGIIRDYKTGVVLQRSKVENSSSPRHDYSVQMKLYAGLFHDVFGKWPDRLELVPLSGGPIIVDFTPEECEGLLARVRTLLGRVNEVVRSLSGNAATFALAVPSPTACKGCGYRPACLPYRHARVMGPSVDWPADVHGEVAEVVQLWNGRLALNLACMDESGTRCRVRGLDPDPERHVAIDAIRNGAEVSLFDLQKTADELSYTESTFTAIYVHGLTENAEATATANV